MDFAGTGEPLPQLPPRLQGLRVGLSGEDDPPGLLQQLRPGLPVLLVEVQNVIVAVPRGQGRTQLPVEQGESRKSPKTW